MLVAAVFKCPFGSDLRRRQGRGERGFPAVKYGYVKSNPVRGVDLPPEGIREQVVLPTADHLATLMDGLEEPYSPMVWLHAVGSMRPSEGFAFKWSDLNIERKQLMLVRAVNRGKFHTPKFHRQNRPIRILAS
jgi:hypothetical protein